MSAFAAPPQRALRTDFNVEPVGYFTNKAKALAKSAAEKARALKDSAQQKLGELKEFGGNVVDAAKAAKKAAEEALKNKKSKV
jgi:hypothetical protein